RRRARSSTTVNRPVHARFLFAAMALPQTDSLRPSFSCWPIRNGGPRASPRPSHEQPAFPVHLRSDRPSPLSPRLWLELSRSLSRCQWFLNRRTNDHIASIRSGNCTADQNHFFGFTHLHDLKILNGHALVAEVARHPHVFPNPSRSGTVADGTDASMGLRTVGGALPVEVMFFHHALKPFSFRPADYIDIVTRLKLRDV